MDRTQTIAVLLPCYNEENTIGKTVLSFKAALPEASIYVCDNNSSDNTINVAEESGAIILKELRQGKGHAVRKMIASVNADVYVLCDGDNTYDSSSSMDLVNHLLENKLDMVVASRMESYATTGYRPGHTFGNRLITSLVNFLFKSSFTDVLSGYRVMSRRFVKSFPVMSKGFEIGCI